MGRLWCQHSIQDIQDFFSGSANGRHDVGAAGQSENLERRLNSVDSDCQTYGAD